jgi:hypothetical protein
MSDDQKPTDIEEKKKKGKKEESAKRFIYSYPLGRKLKKKK